MKTSPNEPTDAPSWYSSVLASCVATSTRDQDHQHRRIGIVIVHETLEWKRAKDKQAGVCKELWLNGDPTYLQVHVIVGGHQVTFVFHPPFEPDHDRFAGQISQERFRVHRLQERGESVVGLVNDGLRNPLKCTHLDGHDVSVA